MLYPNIIYIFIICLVKNVLTIDVCNENTSTEVNSYILKNVTTQCGCDRTICVIKCCKGGYYLKGKYCTRKNVSDSFKMPIYNDKTILVSELNGQDNFMLGVMDCNFRLNNSNTNETFYVQENGTLWISLYKKIFDNNKCCLDELYEVTVLLCYPDENIDMHFGTEFNIIGMIISMPFLLVTFLVYAILPESNIHRKALMFYVLSLLIAYITLVTIQLHNKQFGDITCPALGYATIFFFMASFFWMNVMCIDMWFAFSGMRGFNGQKNAEQKRFIFYCIYACGMPTLQVLIVFLINHYGDSSTSYHPGIGYEKCFLREDLPNLLYFYGPLAILISINVVLFILTAVKIQKVKKETSMLKHSDSKKHNYEDDKQKFNLYLKLLFAMGINWTMEFISWAVEWQMGKRIPVYVWYLTDFCNAMYGVFIFFIFVFKRKIWKSLEKRYYVFIGKPHMAHSITTTRTTRSSNYSTTETGLSEHRMSDFKHNKPEERALTQN